MAFPPFDLDNASVSFKCCLVANVVFWLASSVNLWFDCYMRGSPQRKKFKLQPKIQLSPSEIQDIFWQAVLNMVIIAPLSCPVFELIWDIVHPPGTRLQEEDEWIFTRETICLSFFALFFEASFSGVHWILHRPFWYRHIHKVHHRFKAPCSMAAVYAHPLEHVFGNVAWVALGPIITNAHPYTAYFWYALALFTTCKDHCGYDFMSANTHDDHHQYFNCNYGSIGLFDHLLGTGRPSTEAVGQEKPK